MTIGHRLTGKIVVEANYCERCGHIWLPRASDRPAMCPECKSWRWDKAIQAVVNCKRCGHTWEPQSSNRPRVCAKCNSFRWDKQPKGEGVNGPS